MTDPADTVLEEAARLRRLGMAPIPMVNWKGFCPRPYAEYREGGMPSSVFERIVREDKAHGIQCFTSAAWGVVVEGDGREGVARWESWCGKLGAEPTWKSITPSGGVHWWYSVPADVPWVPKVHLWRGEGHDGVEVLGDGTQARCWPSYKTLENRKVHYLWEAGHRPWDIPRAVLPAWALDLALALRPAPEPGATLSPEKSIPYVPVLRPLRAGRLPEWTDIRDAVDPDHKLYLAQAWGLRVCSRTPNPSGWLPCRSIFRDDRTPSASFCPKSGGYWESELGVRNFFWLAITLGAYPDFPEAVEDLARIAGLDRRTA